MVTNQKFRLPCYRIKIDIVDGDGEITSALCAGIDTEDEEYSAAMDAIEILILEHALAGVNIESSTYINGLKKAVETIKEMY